MAQSIKTFMAIALCTISLVASAQTNHWATYQNKKAHIQFQYPGHLTPSSTFKKTYFSQALWSLNAAAANNNPQQHNIVELPIYNTQFNAAGLGKAFYSLFIRIGMSQDKNDIKNCRTASDLPFKQKITHDTINGIAFTVIPYQDGAMMKVLDATLYRTLQDHTCYSVEMITYRSDINLPKTLQAEVNQQQNRAKNVINSFQFIG